MSAHRRARRFFWAWLIGSAVASTAGVVVHAVLGEPRSAVIASALATVVVAIQLCSTLGVHMLVQAQITGGAYRCALAAAGVLAAGAFVVNYVALRDLALTQASIDPAIAWIVPLIIDLGMTSSTVALLALNGQPAVWEHTESIRQDQNCTEDLLAKPSVHVEVRNTVHNTAHTDAHLAAAHRLVAEGIVRISPERVAQVLAEQSAGTAPSMIARRLSVGYSTVTKILENQPPGVPK